MQIAQWLAHSDNVSLYDDEGLRAHLAACPDPSHPEAKQLAGWLSLRTKTTTGSMRRAWYLRFWDIRTLLIRAWNQVPFMWRGMWMGIMILGLGFALVLNAGVILGYW